MADPTTTKGQRVSRRRVLALGGSAITGGLAGCPVETSIAEEGRKTATPTLSPAPVPAVFELVSLTYLQEVELREPVRYAFTVANTASGQYRFETTIRSTIPGTRKESTHRVSATIPPGETHTFQVTDSSFHYLRRREITIDAFERTFTIESVAKLLAFGEMAFEEGRDLPDLLSVTITELALVDAPANEDTHWVFATVLVLNGRWTTNTAPPPTEITVQTPGAQYQPSTPPAAVVPPPLDRADEQYEKTTLQSKGGTTGWLAYAIPSSHTVADLRMRWERSYVSGTVAAEWEPT